MYRLILILSMLLLVGVTEAKVPKGCPCTGPTAVDIPLSSPVAGTYPSAQTVTLTTSTVGASIYYTTDSSTPTFPITGTTLLYTAPISITSTKTIKAIGVKSGLNTSAVGIFLFTIQTQAATPVIVPVTGTYPRVAASATCTPTPGCVMHYTYTPLGTTPTCSSTTYSGTITITTTGVLKMISCAAVFLNSAVASASYTISGGGAAPCLTGVTVGTLNLSAKATRANGVSPLFVFFDATSTTDSGLINANATPFQDITYSWNFADTQSSGTGTWAYGSNAAVNSMNTATGAVAAHVYILPDGAGDHGIVVTLTATDGTNTAQCTVPVTVYDPAGTNGFPTTATTCFFNATLGTGCPTGATHTTASTFNAVGANLAGKRLLYKCGDTFTGNSKTVSGSKWSIGAYGSCPGTQTNRPIFSIAGGAGTLWAATSFDGRFSDIDIEGNGTGSAYAMQGLGSGTTYPYQITMNNINVNGVSKSFTNFGGHEIGFIQVVQTGVIGSNIGAFINQSENQCINGSTSFNCGNGGTTYNPSNYASVLYTGILGSLFDGIGGSGGSGIEVVRVSACRQCLIENTTIRNATGIGAVLKFHDGNANSQNNWTGQSVANIVISDDSFSGTSGAQLLELAPQNGQVDERLENILIERNYFNAGVGAQDGRMVLLSSCTNGTIRDNVFYIPSSATNPPYLGAQVAKRGVECTLTSGAPVITGTPLYTEVYNNTCNFLHTQSGQNCIGIQGTNFTAAGTQGWGINNLYYSSSGTGSAVNNTGTGNTISNNTSTVTNNPAFTDGSGLFNIISDFKPTANYTGGINSQQPVFTDALGVTWTLPYDLGAVHH